ncbi:MAG: glutamine--fructose-6-phosphate aminotransferase, partial [Pseudobutyrivibrio sp.]|nr:glutamine--fructose-6-phosphate aminotransferase [Pseudobutyrivibrio sp.]
MCGIIGYIGNDALAKILKGLELLEYRGYDSAGIAVRRIGEGQSEVYKCQGRVSDLRGLVPTDGDFSCGIGHTRWATHGGVNDINAHPHKSGQVTLVHNGIIENYALLKEEYELGDKLISETDTEVVAALINKFYKGNPQEAISRTVKKLKGTYALVIMFDDLPDTIFAVRNVSPIVVGKADNQMILASDPAAIYDYTKEYFVLAEDVILTMNASGYTVEDFAGNPVEVEFTKVDWDVSSVDKQGFPYYMAKEIFEQPSCIRRILSNYLVNNDIELGFNGELDKVLKSFNRVCIVACGTALHAGMMGAQLIRKWCGL